MCLCRNSLPLPCRSCTQYSGGGSLGEDDEMQGHPTRSVCFIHRHTHSRHAAPCMAGRLWIHEAGPPRRPHTEQLSRRKRQRGRHVPRNWLGRYHSCCLTPLPFHFCRNVPMRCPPSLAMAACALGSGPCRGGMAEKSRAGSALLPDAGVGVFPGSASSVPSSLSAVV